MRTTEAVGFQWRPVENAPKDGREILVVTRHDEYRVCNGTPTSAGVIWNSIVSSRAFGCHCRPDHDQAAERSSPSMLECDAPR